MAFFWTNVTQVLLLGDTSRHGSGRLEARGRQEHGAVFREFSGLQPPFLCGIARKLVRILFPFRRWKGETPGKQSTSVQ